MWPWYFCRQRGLVFYLSSFRWSATQSGGVLLPGEVFILGSVPSPRRGSLSVEVFVGVVLLVEVFWCRPLGITRCVLVFIPLLSLYKICTAGEHCCHSFISMSLTEVQICGTSNVVSVVLSVVVSVTHGGATMPSFHSFCPQITKNFILSVVSFSVSSSLRQLISYS